MNKNNETTFTLEWTNYLKFLFLTQRVALCIIYVRGEEIFWGRNIYFLLQYILQLRRNILNKFKNPIACNVRDISCLWYYKNWNITLIFDKSFFSLFGLLAKLCKIMQNHQSDSEIYNTLSDFQRHGNRISQISFQEIVWEIDTNIVFNNIYISQKKINQQWWSSGKYLICWLALNLADWIERS